MEEGNQEKGGGGASMILTGFFLCEIHPSPCKQNAGQRSFGVFKTSFTHFEKEFLSFLRGSCRFVLKNYKFSPFPHNFVNKNALKRVPLCKFFFQTFCNVEFAQICQKIEFREEKSSFPRNAQKSLFTYKDILTTFSISSFLGTFL